MTGESGPKVGLVAAVEDAMAGQGPEAPEPDGEQLPLLPLPLKDIGADGQLVEQPRRAGRPPGARNKRTEAWLDWFGARYRMPLEMLGQVISRPADVLALELGCSRHDAYKLQVEAARALLPYCHQKQPVAVQIDGASLVQLIIEDPAGLAGAAQAGDGAFLIEGEILNGESEENQ